MQSAYCPQDDTDDEPELIPAEPTQEARSRGSEQPKTPPKGSRPPPKLASDSPAWKPSLRGGEAVDRCLRMITPRPPSKGDTSYCDVSLTS